MKKATNTGSCTLEKRRKRDLLIVYRVMKELENIKQGSLTNLGYGKILRKDNFRRDINKFSFQEKCVQVWSR